VVALMVWAAVTGPGQTILPQGRVPVAGAIAAGERTAQRRKDLSRWRFAQRRRRTGRRCAGWSWRFPAFARITFVSSNPCGYAGAAGCGGAKIELVAGYATSVDLALHKVGHTLSLLGHSHNPATSCTTG